LKIKEILDNITEYPGFLYNIQEFLHIYGKIVEMRYIK